MTSYPLSAVVLLLSAVLAGCKSDRPPAAAAATPAAASESLNAADAPATITVTASDYALELSSRVPAGAVRLHLVNHGKEFHQAQVIKLEQGKTVADFAAAMKQGGGAPPSWVRFVGGPNGIAPGQETDATIVLPPGQYAVLCFIPSPDGIPHIMKGMIHPFEVTGGTNIAGALPAADNTITLTDYTFEAAKPLAAGRQTILVYNAGPQPHELVLIKLGPGKSVEDFGNWAEGGMKGPPPAMPVGGVTFLDKGARGVFTADLTPGEYGLICFVPDAKDGKPHLAHGMTKQVTVR